MIEKIKSSRISAFLAVAIMAMFMTSTISVLAVDLEPNSTFDEARYCYGGDTIYGALDDTYDIDDYHVISLNAGDYITVTMEMDGYDFDLYFYDEYEWELDSSTYSEWYNTINYWIDETGDYYIQCHASYGVGDYELTIDVEGSGSNEIYVGGDYYVTGDPIATLPTLTVGDSVYWGGVKDIGKEFEQEIDQGLEDIEDLGFDVSYDINGGIGAYFGLEVASDSADVDGVDCYDIEINGAIAIDFGLEASIDGDIDQEGMSMSIDGSGNGYLQLEASLEGHLYLTVDELAVARFTLDITAEGHGEFDLDADYDMSGYGQTISQSIQADGSMDVDGVVINLDLTFDPPMDIYQFGTGNGGTGIYEGKQWYVPGYDTDVSGSLNAQGTISYEMHGTIPSTEGFGSETVDESDSVNLATEIGNNDFSETLPGGEYDYWDGGGTMFTCSYASGDVFVIEPDMGSAFDMDYGTRQDIGGLMDPGSLIPSAGLQFNKATGLISGMTMDGELMTEIVDVDAVEDFIADPLKEVKSVTGGHSSGLDAGLLGIILIGVIVIVVVVIVVVMLTKKKTPPAPPYQQPYQQPPPPPPEYQPDGQYQQQQYQQPPDSQNPPPPPPPGY